MDKDKTKLEVDENRHMSYEEKIKEVDRIAKNKHESWHYIFDCINYREREKLNNFKVYECQDNLSWYIKVDNYNEFAVYPFGFFFVDYFNQLASLKSKDTFLAYEKRMRLGAKSKKDINPTFDKRFRFFLWNYNECSNFNTKADISDKELEEMYNSCCWLWEWIKGDIGTLAHNLNYLKTHTASMQDILQHYMYINRMVLLIWNRQEQSSIYNKNSEYYYSSDEYTCVTDEDIRRCEEETKELIDYDFVTKAMSSQFRYMGYEMLPLTDSSESYCKKYDMPNLLFLVAEDFMRFVLHQTTHNFSFCPECSCLFATTHGNQKHCPACNWIIRQKKRKHNKTRYLHKNITDYINNYRDETSKIFRDESNYYWSIVQGKNPEKIEGYSDKIKTEADYMKWLEKKYAEIKSQK